MASEVVVKNHSSGGKRSRLSGLQKLAFFCYSFEDGNTYELYVVEVDFGKICGGSCSSSSSSDYIEICPMIRIVGPQLWGGCVFNSTLYVFEGNDDSFEDDIFHDDRVLRNSVKKFVLSSDIVDSNVVRGIEVFEELAPMKYPKKDPIAVPTPDGKKILVFSATIGIFDPYPCPVELYDPFADAWEEVEPPNLGRKKIIDVQAYAFITQFMVLLETREGEVFFLDLKPKNRICDPAADTHVPWKKNWKGGKYGHFITINDQIVLTPGSVFSRESDDLHEFTLSPPLYLPFMPAPFPTITFLDYDDHEEKNACYTLVSQSRVKLTQTYDRSFFILIDVCHTDLNNLHTTTIGNLKYVVRGGAYHVFSLEMFLI